MTVILDENRGDKGAQLASVGADGSGGFCTPITLGANLQGAHKLMATGTTSGGTATAKIRVRKSGVSVAGVSLSAVTTAGAGTTSGGLAFTGANAISIGALGALLVVGGGAMVLAGKRRKVNA